VTQISTSITNADAQLLTEFLIDPKRPEGTLRFHELQGFLFAIASSPETIPTPEWLSSISNDEEFGFEDEHEAQRILNSIIALFNEVNTTVLERSEALPRGCEFNEDVLSNFDERSTISEWSRGFLVGHDWLSELWEEYLIDEMDEECGATTMVLTFFSSRRLGEAYFQDTNSKRKISEAEFEKFGKKVRKLFPTALASYAHLGRTIFEALLEAADTDEPRH